MQTRRRTRRHAPRNPGGEMSILEHIAELRDRLVKSCVALTVTTLVAAFVLYDRTFRFITKSYCDIDPEVPDRHRGGSWLRAARAKPP